MTHTITLGFTGEFRDLIVAAYPLGSGYRWYFPALMRFNGPDEASPFGPGGLNPYAYCADDPISYSDPTGHFAVGNLLERLFPRATRSETAVDGIGHAAPASTSIAAERAASAAHPAPPAYNESLADDRLPPSYHEADHPLHAPPAYDPRVPTYHQEVVRPLYNKISKELSSLQTDMSKEVIRLYRGSGAKRSTPSRTDLIRAYLFDNSRWRELRNKRIDELRVRADNLDEYRARLLDVKKNIGATVDNRTILDADPVLKGALIQRYRELKDSYRFLAD